MKGKQMKVRRGGERKGGRETEKRYPLEIG